MRTLLAAFLVLGLIGCYFHPIPVQTCSLIDKSETGDVIYPAPAVLSGMAYLAVEKPNNENKKGEQQGRLLVLLGVPDASTAVTIDGVRVKNGLAQLEQINERKMQVRVTTCGNQIMFLELWSVQSDLNLSIDLYRPPLTNESGEVLCNSASLSLINS